MAITRSIVRKITSPITSGVTTHIGALLKQVARYFNKQPVSLNDEIIDNINGLYPLSAIKQNCITTTKSNAIDFDSRIVDGGLTKWAYEFDFSEIDVTNPWNVILGDSADASNLISLRNSTTNVFAIRRRGSWLYGTYDTSLITEGKLQVLCNGVDVKFYHNENLVDTIITDGDLNNIGTILNYVSSSTIGFVGKANDFKFWNFTSFNSGEIVVDLLDSELPNVWFGLNDYNSDDGIDSPFVYRCRMGSGIIGTVRNGSITNISIKNGISNNFKYGFATIDAKKAKYPKLNDGSGYAGLTGLESGFTPYNAWNNASEQFLNFPDEQALKDIDKQNVLFDSGGTPIDIDSKNIPQTSYSVPKVDINIITDYKILNKKPIVEMWLVAGQSNTDGRVPISSPPSWLDVDNIVPNTQMWNRINDAFADWEYGVNSGANGAAETRWAFDSTAIKRYAELKWDKTQYVVKRSLGGTSIGIDPIRLLTACWNADFDAVKQAYPAAALLLDQLREEYALAKAALIAIGFNVEVKGLLWHQGESDSYSANNIAAYYQNFKNVISYVRGFVGNSNMPVVFGTIPHVSVSYNADIETAQLQIASEDNNAYCIDLSEATLLDDYHLDATSAEAFGDSVYEIIKNF